MAQRLIVVSNRGPYRQERGGRWVRAAGGLVTALDPVLRRRGGAWVSGAVADGPIAGRSTQLDINYELSTVPLSKALQSGYYDGFANAVLWPLLHGFQPTIRLANAPWAAYQRANALFTARALDISAAHDPIWVQDYHLMLLPELLRQHRPTARIGWFCHIPWPHPEAFAILPWRQQLLQGLLGSDVLGFHTDKDAHHFLECVQAFTDHSIDLSTRTVTVAGRPLRVITAPIGIAVREIQALAQSPKVREEASRIRSLVGGRRIILGVDRLDYTKGIPERLLAYERFLREERHANTRFVYVQVMVPSRTDIHAYTELKREVDRMVGDINGRFAAAGRIPVHYFFRNLNQVSLYGHYRAADVALVTPLRDGMNLVAQEYITAHTEGDGALILSEFAGAAHYLSAAYQVNPYDIDAMCATLSAALEQTPEEMQRRMRSLQSAVAQLDVHRWAAGYLDVLTPGTRFDEDAN